MLYAVKFCLQSVMQSTDHECVLPMSHCCFCVPGAQGVGRSMLAASLAQELVSSQHWTDAYWIDMQGVTNVVLAGKCVLVCVCR